MTLPTRTAAADAVALAAPKFCLIVTCPSTRGIVAAIAGFLAGHGCNIADSAQYDDPGTGRFFMRVSFAPETGAKLTRWSGVSPPSPPGRGWNSPSMTRPRR